MTEELERKVIQLIAADRIDIPISSMSGKLKRMKPKLGQAISVDECTKESGGEFKGNRAYARIESEDLLKARGMKEGIEVFSKEYPEHGKILKDYIEEQREEKELHLYFGLNSGCKLTADDYMGVMKSLGFTEAISRDLYPELMEVSRKLSRKRDEERSVMIG
ncbi:hypothetical protein J4409_02815 [Candidatus Woesearchaeota archaeon]|nr:hypothetical protein [Candidatus Woesearchaeota archaeon]